MKTKLSSIAALVFFIVTLINVANPIRQNLVKFTERFNPKKYERQYNLSQYVIPQSKNPISDEVLLSYAGYRYATGLNPILINSDHPPLGKYLIGWFTLLTGNNRLVSVFFALGNLILVFLLIYFSTKSVLLSSLGMLLLSFDSMFIDQLIHSPILDIIQVFFLLLYFLLFILWLKKEQLWKIIVMGLALGAMSATKLYFPVFVVLATTLIMLIFLKKSAKKILFLMFLITLLTGVIYTGSYLAFFLKGNSLRAFLGVQKWIFLFWKNNSVQSNKFIGDALTLILFNQWKVWWGNKTYLQFELWTILWPTFFIAGIISATFVLIKALKTYFSKNIKKIKNNFLLQSAVLFSVWIFLSTAYLSLLPISPRYLMILYFPIYVIIPMVIKLIYQSY
jgi:4-amino-4-deoxy-L-arabinose transferase-like glycosyltransferase